MKEETLKKILVIGAGEAGRMVKAEIDAHPRLGAVVAGFLDDDDSLTGEKVASVEVLGRTSDLEEICEKTGIDEIIIAVPTAPGLFVREMVRRCRRAGLPYKIVPGVMEIIKGDVHIDQIREVRVEDLLGRETVNLDTESAKRSFAGKRILVTGAGGSIGSEICRQLSKAEPESLVLLGRGENRIFDIEEELRSAFPGLELSTVIANITDAEKTDRVIKAYSPHYVYHAAAHKHVHYMERDPAEAVINNIWGSANLIDACDKHGVEKFVFISSDKAADPTGVMGASKRVTEMYLEERGRSSDCSFITVRFGNVIGSRGSVVPLFMRQIGRGGPVTVSDADATRYFMTVREAASLVIRSSLIGGGGETFILDMGEPLNILEMARDMIILSGHEPDVEIEISITGLREGEKLHEVLHNGEERLEPSSDGKIFKAIRTGGKRDDIETGMSRLVEAARTGSSEEVLRIFAGLIPGFDPEGTSAS